MSLRFLEFELDPERFSLKREGQPVPAERRVLDLVLYLLRNRARVVPREELLREVWAGVTVGDHVLTQALHAARRLLSDDAKKPRIFETVRGRGIRFVAEVVGSEPTLPPMVGRDEALRQLEGCLRDARNGRTTFALISGDAGIGKTRLCEQFERRAAELGVVSLVGRCSESGPVAALHPWIQLTQALRRIHDPEDWRRWGLRYPELNLVEGDELSPDERAAIQGDGSRSRTSVLGRLASFWREQARERRLALVLEDLHRADEASWQLLLSMVRDFSSARLMIVCTFREGELLERIGGTAGFRELSERCDAVVSLGPLTFSDCRTLAQGMEPSMPPETLVRLHSRSGGNPLFWLRLHDMLASGQYEDEQLPLTVREAVDRQVSGLSEPCKRVLEVASVVGRNFAIDVVASVLGQSLDDTFEHAQEAQSHGILREGGVHAEGLLAFSHEIVRECIYQELRSSTRRRLHAKVADSLKALRSGSDKSTLAHHHYLAMPFVGPADAFESFLDAGLEAVERLAYEGAVPLLERARELEQSAQATAGDRCRVLLGLAESHLRCGERVLADHLFREAADLAEAEALSEELAEVALRVTPGILAIDYLQRDHLAESILGRARAACKDGPQKALICARLAMALYWADGTEREREHLIAEAKSLLSQVEDPSTRGFVRAYELGSLWRPENLSQRRAAAAEVVALGRAGGNSELEALGHIFLITCLQESTGGWALERQVDDLAELVEGGVPVGPEVPWYLPLYRASLALSRGEWDVVAATSAEFLAVGKSIGGSNLELSFAGVTSAVLYLTGRAGEALDQIDAMIARFPDFRLWRTARLISLAAVGNLECARCELPEVADEVLGTTDQLIFRLPAIAQLADVCADVGDIRTSQRLIPELTGFEGNIVTLGYGVLQWGPVARPLGRLSSLLGKLDQGIQLLEQAVATTERAVLIPWRCLSTIDLAEALRNRGAAGDAERARECHGFARDLAERLDMAHARRRCQALGRELGIG